MTEPVSRAEFNMLSSQVTENRRQLEHIDETGTRGIGIIAAQMTDVVKDVNSLQSDFREHIKVHQAEEQIRINSRRWIVGAFIAGIASVSTILALLLDISAKIHG